MAPTSWQLELMHPAWLIGLAALAVLGYYHRRSLVDFAHWQRLLSLAVRTAIVVLLVLALGGLTLLLPTREQYVIFAIDRSLSVGDESRKEADYFLDKALAAMGSNRAAFVAFAKDPGLVQADRAKLAPLPDDKGTNLAAVIEAAAGAMPPNYVPHIVLLTDGNATDGDTLKAALRAGVPISTVPLKTR